jgi:plastocyanin
VKSSCALRWPRQPHRFACHQGRLASQTKASLHSWPQAFAPATLTVTAGTTVTWKNEDDSPHRIGDKNGAFKSAALDTDDTFSHTFAAPGEYPYICTIHPYMVGKVIVKPAGPAS